jgi:hypothetical protein
MLRDVLGYAVAFVANSTNLWLLPHEDLDTLTPT